jgi:hypothetical protein
MQLVTLKYHLHLMLKLLMRPTGPPLRSTPLKLQVLCTLRYINKVNLYSQLCNISVSGVFDTSGAFVSYSSVLKCHSLRLFF